MLDLAKFKAQAKTELSHTLVMVKEDWSLQRRSWPRAGLKPKASRAFKH